MEEPAPSLRAAAPLLIAVAAVVVGIVLTILFTLAQRPSSLRVPTNPDLVGTAKAGAAALDGTLGAKDLGDRVCFWVDLSAASGSLPAGSRVTLVFPDGWTAAAGPVLRDDRGRTVARPGAPVTVARSDETQLAPAGCPSAHVAGALRVTAAG